MQEAAQTEGKAALRRVCHINATSLQSVTGNTGRKHARLVFELIDAFGGNHFLSRTSVI